MKDGEAVEHYEPPLEHQVSRREAARILGLSLRQLDRYARPNPGRLTKYTFDDTGIIVFDRREVEAFAAQRRRARPVKRVKPPGHT